MKKYLLLAVSILIIGCTSNENDTKFNSINYKGHYIGGLIDDHGDKRGTIDMDLLEDGSGDVSATINSVVFKTHFEANTNRNDMQKVFNNSGTVYINLSKENGKSGAINGKWDTPYFGGVVWHSGDYVAVK